MNFNLYWAQVVKVNDETNNTDDPVKENRIQIKVSPIMDGWTDAHLPWARPMFPAFTGGTVNSGISAVPQVDSNVWVWFEDEEFFKKACYVFDGRYPNATLAKKFYDDVKPELTKMSPTITAPTSQYPDVVSFHYENGICIAYDTNANNPVIVTYHPSGSYTIIDKDGNIGLYSDNDVRVETKNGVKFYTDGANTHFTDGNTPANQVDTTASKIDITVTGGTVNLKSQNVNLAGDATLIEQVIKGTTFMSELLIAFNTHIHDCPQAPSGMLPSKPPTVPWTDPGTFASSKSNFVKTN